MSEHDQIRTRIFRGLVERAGGVDAAAAILEEAYGAASKGTVSRMTSGHAAVTVAAVRALEDTLGVYPITIRLFERINAGASGPCDLRAMAARLSQGSGETVSSLVLAFSDVSPDPSQLTDEERAEVNAQARELRDICDNVIAATEGGNVRRVS